MLREINLDEISDGKLYSSNDMARTDCKGCDGCSACCHGMGSSIVLDPLDVYRLSINLSKPVNELLAGPLELNVADGIILPNLKMTGTKEACSFYIRASSAFAALATWGRRYCSSSPGAAQRQDSISLAWSLGSP